MQKKVNVIGLGKLGACTAVCFASKGLKVLGYDNNDEAIKSLKNYKAHIIEKDFQKYLSKNKKNLRFTSDLNELIKNSNTTFIIVPTPSLKDDSFDNSYVIKVLKDLSNKIRLNKSKFHHFVINSTVMPNSCFKSFVPIIEKYSGLKFNKGFFISYNPEFIALGSVIKDFLNPDMILIGQSSIKGGDELEKIYRTVCENNPKFNRMSLVSAEITKISLNAFVTMKISFANVIKNICDDHEGSNPLDITKALGSDKRISPFYINPGLPFGGPCFPRDNKAFVNFTTKKSNFYHLANSTDLINDFHTKEILQNVKKLLTKYNQRKISIYGLAFKEGSNVIEKSISIELIKKFKNIEFHIYDKYFDSFTIYNNSKLEKNIKNLSNNKIVFLNHKMHTKNIKKYFKKNIVIDYWN